MTRFEPVHRPTLRAACDDVDIAIVGAGAAGIGAARAALALGLTVCVIEARDRVGGRALTSAFGGHPVDLGAHWLHAGKLNPLLRLGLERGEPLRKAPRGQHIVLEGRFGDRAERHSHGGAFERADRAFSIAARAERDLSLAAAFPPMGRWRRPSRATFALISGRPLDEVSVQDFPSQEFADNYFIRGGYGAYVSRLAAGLPVALDTPVERLDWSGQGVTVGTARGEVRARAAIVTAPAAVLAQGSIRFVPALPAELAEALASLLPGTYEHVLVRWPDAPFHQPDRLAKLVSSRASFGMMTRIDDAPFHYLELDHRTVSSVARDTAQLARLARSILIEQFGSRAIANLRVLAVTDWVGDPWSRAAWAVAPPGHAGARDRLSHPFGERIWLAGEANARDMWGTVGGAWEAGEKAAAQAAALLGPRR